MNLNISQTRLKYRITIDNISNVCKYDSTQPKLVNESIIIIKYQHYLGGEIYF